MVTPIQGPDGSKSVNGPSGPKPKPTAPKTTNVDMKIPDTKEAKESQKRIKTAMYQLEVLKVKVKDPNIKPEEAVKLQAQINALENVYKNSTYEIDATGKVTFKIKGHIPVTDFKKAYGLTDGALQPHLKARHNEDNPRIVEAEIYIDDHKTTVDDYDENTTRFIDGGVARDAEGDGQGIMEYDYMMSERGSFIRYSDGMEERKVKLFFGGTGSQKQYDGMALRADETFSLSQGWFKKAE